MDYLALPMFDVSNIDMWELRMSAYLKILGLHVYLAATKKSLVIVIIWRPMHKP